MTDKEEILSLLNRYSHTVDGGDIEDFVGLFEKGEWYINGAKGSSRNKPIDCAAGFVTGDG